MSWSRGSRTRLRLLFAPRAAESRMNEEMGFHIEMETDRLVREEGSVAGGGTPSRARHVRRRHPAQGRAARRPRPCRGSPACRSTSSSASACWSSIRG